MATDMSAILSGTATPDPAPPPAPDPQPAPETPDQQPPERRDEELDDGWDGGEDPDTGDKQPAPAGPEVPPAEDGENAKSVPVAALRKERQRRQEVERRLAELEAQGRQAQGPQDPSRERLDLSVEYAKEQFEDYDQAEAAFVEAVRRHPNGQALYDRMMRERHPARFAYEVGQKLLALRQIGDPRSYRDRLRAEFEAEYKAKAPAPRPAPSIPQTLAASRDAGGRFVPRDHGGATPMAEILRR